jgi:hypothetical protein
MSELDRADARHRLGLADGRLRGEHFAYSALRIFERQHLRNSGNGIIAGLTTQALCFDALAYVVEFSVAGDLKGKPRTTGLRTGLKSYNKIAVLGRKIRASVVPLGYV